MTTTFHSAIFAQGVPPSTTRSYVSGEWHPVPAGMRPCCLTDRGTVRRESLWRQDRPETITEQGVKAWTQHVVTELSEMGEAEPLIGLDIEHEESKALVPDMVRWVREGSMGVPVQVVFYVERKMARASPWGDAPGIAAGARAIRDCGWIHGAIAEGGFPALATYIHEGEHTHAQWSAPMARASIASELAVYEALGAEPVGIVGLQLADPGGTPEHQAAVLNTMVGGELLQAQFRPVRSYRRAMIWGVPFWYVNDAGKLAQRGSHTWSPLSATVMQSIVAAAAP